MISEDKIYSIREFLTEGMIMNLLLLIQLIDAKKIIEVLNRGFSWLINKWYRPLDSKEQRRAMLALQGMSILLLALAIASSFVIPGISTLAFGFFALYFGKLVIEQVSAMMITINTGLKAVPKTDNAFTHEPIDKKNTLLVELKPTAKVYAKPSSYSEKSKELSPSQSRVAMGP